MKRLDPRPPETVEATVVLAPGGDGPDLGPPRWSWTTRAAALVVVVLAAWAAIARLTSEPSADAGAGPDALRPPRRVGHGPLVQFGKGALIFATSGPDSTAQRLWRLSLANGELLPGPRAPGMAPLRLESLGFGRVGFVSPGRSGSSLYAVETEPGRFRESVALASAFAYSVTPDSNVAFARYIGDSGDNRPPGRGRLEVGLVAGDAAELLLGSVTGDIPGIEEVFWLQGEFFVYGWTPRGPQIARVAQGRLVPVLRGWIVDGARPQTQSLLVHRWDAEPTAAPFLWSPRGGVRPLLEAPPGIKAGLAWDRRGFVLAAVGDAGDGEGLLIVSVPDGRTTRVAQGRPFTADTWRGARGAVAFSEAARYAFYVRAGGIWAYDRQTGETLRIFRPPPGMPQPAGPLVWVP